MSEQEESSSMGRLLIAVLVLTVAGYIAFKTFFPDGWSPGDSAADYTRKPKTMELTYKPSNFKFEVDEDEALRILSNPQQNRSEFNDLILDFNKALLSHVAVRMGLSKSDQAKVVKEYDRHHEYIVQMYYNDFITLKDTTSYLYQAWYENESANAVDLLNEVGSKYTCFFVNQVLSSVLETNEGRIKGKGNKVETPCGVALTEALRPMIERLQERASIADFSRSKKLLNEKVEKAITELATMEVRDKKGLSKELQTKVWGYSVSSTQLEITAISILKVGFKLDEYFDLQLDGKAKTVTVVLPQPTILSHEVYPKVEKLDIGWLREVGSADFNKNINLLREEFRREAISSDLMTKSKTRVAEVMQMMLGPMVDNMPGYALKVKFLKADAGTSTETGK